MSYTANTMLEQKEMLSKIGVSSVSELFRDIPPEKFLSRPLNLPPALSEWELARHLKQTAKKNTNILDHPSFLGAGIYYHYVPSVVGHLTGRSEFYTAYTPYQAEISQGTLQAIYEYQSYICLLTGMDVSNASHYDGATALVESALMACNSNKRNEVFVSQLVHPEYRRVLETIFTLSGKTVVTVPYTEQGLTDTEFIKNNLSNQTSAVIVQNPNFFGLLEDVESVSQIAHSKDSYSICNITDFTILGLLEAPAKLGADIVCGEGQSLGMPPSYGGPLLGVMAAKKDFMRKIPGRLVGKTKDVNGDTAYVLTLQTREQHIRRSKAASNICSNEALCALAATIYLSCLGKAGLQKVAQTSLQKAHYAYEKITSLSNCQAIFPKTAFFHEFVIKLPKNAGEVNRILAKNGIIGGYALDRAYPDMGNCMLVAVTETMPKTEIDRFCDVLEVIK